MKAIIGLGNPGKKYELTRHNIGWLILDEFAHQRKLGYKPGKGEYYFAKGNFEGEEFILVKPTTFMNNSGIAVREVQQHFHLTHNDLLIILDEIQFEVGKLKLKTTGGDGGHNGLASIIYHLNSKNFSRLRCGIGSQFEKNKMVAYVLNNFTQEEREIVNLMIKNAVEAIGIWLLEDILIAMNKVNSLSKTITAN